MDDPYNLCRFLSAQDGVYDQALAELRRGRKASHWMWFVFPQAEGLGRSRMAERYAIRSVAEARAYLDHPVLGARLRDCARTILAAEDRSAEAIFGPVDAIKLRSSLTLFAAAACGEQLFGQCLDRFFAGARDPATLRWMGEGEAN